MVYLTENSMWEAAINNDLRYDGFFYYAVKTTGIFCRPSCRSRQPQRSNVIFFFCLDEALAAGFRPCKRCRPDLVSIDYNPVTELVAKAVSLLETEYYRQDILTELPKTLGVSPFHFQRVFKKHTGFTPKAYLDGIRIVKAKELLLENRLNNTEICFAVGFQSLSTFYSTFRQTVGKSPAEFKKT